MRFDIIWDASGIEYRLTKPNHPRANGQVKRMNLLIKEVTARCFRGKNHNRLRRSQTFPRVRANSPADCWLFPLRFLRHPKTQDPKLTHVQAMDSLRLNIRA
jgi:hypothetical protein